MRVGIELGWHHLLERLMRFVKSHRVIVRFFLRYVNIIFRPNFLRAV